MEESKVLSKRLYCVHEGQGTYAECYQEVTEKECEQYRANMEKEGFSFLESHCMSNNTYYTYAKGKEACFVSYYPSINEMHVVLEPNSNWLQYVDEAGEERVSTLLRQVELDDFGEAYVIRLRDGRLIVFDGGCEKEFDADALMQTLKEFSMDEKPRIAAWIMTHPHLDHYRCFLVLEEKYGKEIEIEKFIYNFPDASESECEAMPGLKYHDEIPSLEKMYQAIDRMGVKVYRAHTGQVYNVGNVKIEILSSPDNTLLYPVKDFNQVSLVIRMEVEGQVILWGGDSYFQYARLDERYGEYLKSDIFQIPHHGFQGGDIKAYDYIAPDVCLVCGFDWVWLGTKFKFFELEYNQHLIYNMDVKEYLMGGQGNITLELPYKPEKNRKEELYALIEKLRKSE